MTIRAGVCFVALASLGLRAGAAPVRSGAPSGNRPAPTVPRCTLAPAGGRATLDLAKDAAGTAAHSKPGDASAFLRWLADVPLPGRPVRFDYQSADSAAGRLYLSHMNDGHIVAFDTRSRRVVAQIPDMPRVTGVWVVPELHRLVPPLPVGICCPPSFALRREPRERDDGGRGPAVDGGLRRPAGRE